MPAHSADRNLLFGILALQMDFIDREALVGAMNAWVIEKNRPLGRLLVERGAMTEAEFALIEPLVTRHVEKHGGDAEKSLAAIGANPSTREALAHVADPDLQASLVHVASPFVEEDPFRTQSYVGRPTSVGTRFRVLQYHAKGGLGVVSIALDSELDRQVALKEIQGERADEPESRSRFVQEAEITGKLEHPGIVPVYGLGHYDDGRPFYAMRFIRGDSLREAIRRFHLADADPKRDPGERAVQLRDLLGRFLDVCDAISYAHSRGVLHRDLKPGNVMLGPFGETLVVDWGLAKPTGQAEDTTEVPLGPVRLSGSISGSRDETVGVVGTLAYMSPEQAEGRLDQLGPASDVFSLGATLYQLLTGQTPYHTEDGEPLLPRVIRGDFQPPRLIKPNVPRALEAICLKAMAVRPEDRYASPRALAEDLKRWLADEPVSAWREPLRIRARRWVSRHRTPVAASVAALTLALLVAGVGWTLYQRREHARLDDVAREVRGALNEAQLAVGAARASNDLSRWSEAVSASRRARSLLSSGGGDASLRRDVASISSRIESDASAARLAAEAAERDRRMRDDLEQAKLQSTRVKRGEYDSESTIAAYRRAFQRYGLDVESLTAREASRRARNSPIREALAAALDEWASFAVDAKQASKLRTIAQAADPDPMRSALRSAVARTDRDDLRRMARDAAIMQLPRTTLLRLGLALRDTGLSEETLAILEAGRRQYPGDFWLNHDLGMAYLASKPARYEEAVRYLTSATALRPDASGPRLNLGNALFGMDRFDEAILEYRRAIEIQPDLSEAHSNLGAVFKEQGKLDEAIAEHRRAIEIDPKNAKAHDNLGAALGAQGRLDEAVAEHRRAVEINPGDAESHYNLGVALYAKGLPDEAIAEYRFAIELRPDHVEAHNNLGGILIGLESFEEAAAEFRRVLQIEPDHAEAHNNLGVDLKKLGKYDEAIAEYQRAIELEPDYAGAYHNLGQLLREMEQLDEAITAYRRAIAIEPEMAVVHLDLGNALVGKGDLDQAIAEFRRAIEINPRYTEAHYNLGFVLKGDEAIAEFRRAIESNPEYFNAHFKLAISLKQQGKLDEAIAEYRRAIEISPDRADAHFNLGIALDDKGLLEEAVSEYRLAIAIDPDDASAHQNLAGVLKQQRKLDEAIDEYRRAIKIDPDDPDAHYNFALALKAQGKLDEAIVETRRAILIKAGFAVAHANLGNLLSDKGLREEAIAEYRRAIEIQPDYALAHLNLGLALQSEGRFSEALVALERGHELGSKQPGWSNPSAQWVEECRRMAELEARLPAILKGEAQAKDAREKLDLADLCYRKSLDTMSARFFEEAFTDQPELSEELKSFRYYAACAAALAGGGKGKDDPPPEDQARAELRRKAINWLRADLAAWEKVIENGPAEMRNQVGPTLRHWREDPDLASIRDEEDLARLPEGGEREACRKLWSDVEALMARASKEPNP